MPKHAIKGASGRFIKALNAFAAGADSTAGMAAGGMGGGIPTAAGAGATAAGGGMLAKLLQGAKGAGRGMAAHPWMTLIALMMAMRTMKSDAPYELQGLQTQMMGKRAAGISPEDIFYQSTMPQAQEEERMMQAALINKLMGTTGPSQLARGEELT